MSIVAYHVTNKDNLRDILSQGLLPKMGPRSKRFGERVPAVYMFPSSEDAETALLNWLGDEFEDDDELAFLEVRIEPDLAVKFCDWEIVSYAGISPDKIKVLDKGI